MLKVPKYLQERFGSLELSSDLIDDCKYLLYFKNGWGLEDTPLLTCVPVKSKKEALQFLKEAVHGEYNENIGGYVVKN